MAEQYGEKTHQATPYRRQKAREQGQVARSQDLTSAALLVGALLALAFLSGGMALDLHQLTLWQLDQPAWLQADHDFAVAQWYRLLWQLARILVPLFGLLLLVAIAVNLGQVGFLFLPQRLAFDVSRISPLKGFQRLFSLSNAMRLAFGVFKILVIACVAIWSLWGYRDTILSIGSQDVQGILAFIVHATWWTCLKIGVALLILAVIDYGYQRWKHERDLRMTDQELREEMKTLQGDPQIIARRRAAQRQLVLNRMNTIVPTADVVVTNPIHLAIAIRYDFETMVAPVVLAKGAGVLAQRIRRLALEHEIPIVERKELARILYKQVDVNHPIPAEQYAAVAEVLRYVYQLKGKPLPTMPDAA